MAGSISDQSSTDLGDKSAADAIDVELMYRCARGDEQALRLLIERHQQAVIGTVARMLNDQHEAEDIAQQVFVRIWNAAPKWKPEAKFTTYLFTVARNLVFNESRRRSRTKEVSSAHSDETLQPDHGMEKRELHQSIDQAIAALPEQQRLAVVLRTFEGMDYEDIARALNTSVSSVKSLLFRARGVLRDSLAGYLER